MAACFNSGGRISAAVQLEFDERFFSFFFLWRPNYTSNVQEFKQPIKYYTIRDTSSKYCAGNALCKAQKSRHVRQSTTEQRLFCLLFDTMSCSCTFLFMCCTVFFHVHVFLLLQCPPVMTATQHNRFLNRIAFFFLYTDKHILEWVPPAPQD